MMLMGCDGVHGVGVHGVGGFTREVERSSPSNQPRCVRAELKADSGLSATASIVQVCVQAVPASSQRTSGHGDPSAVRSPVQAAGALLFSLRRWSSSILEENLITQTWSSEKPLRSNPASASTSGRSAYKEQKRAEWRAGLASTHTPRECSTARNPTCQCE
jgi:hypothetical protein